MLHLIFQCDGIQLSWSVLSIECPQIMYIKLSYDLGNSFSVLKYLSIGNLLQILIKIKKTCYRKQKGLSVLRCCCIYLLQKFREVLQKRRWSGRCEDMYPQILLENLIRILILPVMILLLLWMRRNHYSDGPIQLTSLHVRSSAD